MLKTRLIYIVYVCLKILLRAERLQSCSPSTMAKKMGPSLSLRDTPSCCLLGFSRVAPAEETQSLTSPRGSNVSQYQCTRSIRFVWAGWRSRHEALCDGHDDLNLNRASDLFESLLQYQCLKHRSIYLLWIYLLPAIMPSTTLFLGLFF